MRYRVLVGGIRMNLRVERIRTERSVPQSVPHVVDLPACCRDATVGDATRTTGGRKDVERVIGIEPTFTVG
jgi:hypothetical protein